LTEKITEFDGLELTLWTEIVPDSLVDIKMKTNNLSLKEIDGQITDLRELSERTEHAIKSKIAECLYYCCNGCKNPLMKVADAHVALDHYRGFTDYDLIKKSLDEHKCYE
jgi:hypothetical protein